MAIFTEINLEEKINDQFTINDSASLTQIEKQDEKSLKLEVENLIREMQEKGADIFGFGEYVRAKKPGYWNARIGSKDRWQSAFKELRVEVEVNSKIRRIGMKAK